MASTGRTKTVKGKEYLVGETLHATARSIFEAVGNDLTRRSFPELAIAAGVSTKVLREAAIREFINLLDQLAVTPLPARPKQD